jgi:putative nucleotidyltransferase with HDIG domain
LSGFSPRNAQQVQALLRHSMATGMIAKQLARDMGCNHDQAFVCGLLHDLGWIVMLELLAEYDLPAEKRDQMIMDHHSVVGGLVAKKWNLSEDIQEVIRHHHNPLNAVHYPKLVEVVHISDLLTKTDTPAPETAHSPLYGAMGDVTAPFADRLEELDQEIDAILSPM